MLKIPKIVFLIELSISAMQLNAQGSEFSELNYLYNNNRYGAVWPYYQELLKSDSLNTELNYKMGICYLNSRSQKEKAIQCFKKTISPSDKELARQLSVYKLLADACYAVSDFKEAGTNYQTYEKLLIASNGYSSCEREELKLKLEMCKMGNQLKDLSALNNRKPNSKSNGDDRNSISNGQRLPYVLNDANYFEENTNTLVSDPSSKKIIDTTTTLKEATVATSADGQIILLYRNDKGSCNLYSSALMGNEWSAPEKLNRSINNKGWEPGEFISADGNTLYFSSNRKGGYGGKDIYKSMKQPNGEWGKAINLGPAINTVYDEEAPFINADGLTLYFSSNRYKTKGGFNIFSSTAGQTGTWTQPLTIGYPVNKGESLESALRKDDKKNNRTQRESQYSSKENYKVTFLDQKRIPLTLIKGKVLNKNGKVPGYTEIIVANNETGEISGIYNANIKTGQFSIVLPPGKNNSITYEAAGYMFHSENLDLTRDTSYFKILNAIELAVISVGSEEVLNNVFYKENAAEITSNSYFELKKLFSFLSLNQNTGVEITTSLGKNSSLSEIKLAKDRMEAIANYLTEKGISKERVSAKVYLKKQKRLKRRVKSTEVLGVPDPKPEVKIISIKN